MTSTWRETPAGTKTLTCASPEWEPVDSYVLEGRPRCHFSAVGRVRLGDAIYDATCSSDYANETTVRTYQQHYSLRPRVKACLRVYPPRHGLVCHRPLAAHACAGLGVGRAKGRLQYSFHEFVQIQFM